MPNIDTQNVNETMLDGMSNLINQDQWSDLMLVRSNPEAKDANDKILSPAFVSKYKNMLNFQAFPIYLHMAWNCKHITPEFVRKFWKFSEFIGGIDDPILSDKNFAGQESGLGEWLKANCDLTNTAEIDTGKKAPFTMEQLDKRPFYYNASLWSISLQHTTELTKEFIEKYIHMVDFNAIITNEHLSDDFKKDLCATFGAEAKDGETTYVLFPDGTTIEKGDWLSSNPGREYYSNEHRFPVANDKTMAAIKDLKARFPRAFEDCDYPENAAVMVDK